MRTPEQTAQIFELVVGGRTSDALRLMEQTSDLCPPCNQNCDQGRTCPARTVKPSLLITDAAFDWVPSWHTDVRETWKRFGWLPQNAMARRELLR